MGAAGDQPNNVKRPFSKLAFLASGAPDAEEARRRLAEKYGDCPPEEADCIVALGGDGLMLRTLHRFMDAGKPIYGMNRGSVGFLMNQYRESGLRKRIADEPSVSGACGTFVSAWTRPKPVSPSKPSA